MIWVAVISLVMNSFSWDYIWVRLFALITILSFQRLFCRWVLSFFFDRTIKNTVSNLTSVHNSEHASILECESKPKSDMWAQVQYLECTLLHAPTASTAEKNTRINFEKTWKTRNLTCNDGETEVPIHLSSLLIFMLTFSQVLKHVMLHIIYCFNTALDVYSLTLAVLVTSAVNNIAVAGAAATPPPVPACSGERAGELLISNTCDHSTLPTRAHQIQQSGQKRSLPSVW